MPIGHYLYTICLSGYYAKPDWQGWADQQISKKDEIDDWIFQVSLARNVDEVYLAIADKMRAECYDGIAFCRAKLPIEP